MSLRCADVWARRYREALAEGVIKRRATVGGKAIRDLEGEPIEVACSKLHDGLRAVFLPTARCCELIRNEVERALAHAVKIYTHPTVVLRAAYSDFALGDTYVPTLISGPAGSGKTQLRLAIGRVLSERTELCVDEAHPTVPLVEYADCVIGSQRSVAGVLQTLASPEVAKGNVRLREADLPRACARWQRVSGTCLLGVDEMQFMAQSSSASTLITRTMLSIAEIQIPWFVIANYSLGWKLASRPAEATQRLLGRPTLLLPDRPDSEDWSSLLKEYALVGEEAFGFQLLDHTVDLWNLTAGLKRELVKLLVHAYRVARRSGSSVARWEHVEAAFHSLEFSVSRRDIDLLIAHSGQGVSRRADLLCPFSGNEVNEQAQTYEESLRAVRAAALAGKVIAAAMNSGEKEAIQGLKASDGGADSADSSQAVSPKRRGKRTVQGMLAAARRAQQRRDSPGSRGEKPKGKP